MIAEQRDKYSWQFVFLGANQDAISSAAQFGIAAGAALTYGADNAGTLAAFGILGQKTQEYRATAAAAGGVANWVFDEIDRRRATGKS